MKKTKEALQDTRSLMKKQKKFYEILRKSGVILLITIILLLSVYVPPNKAYAATSGTMTLYPDTKTWVQIYWGTTTGDYTSTDPNYFDYIGSVYVSSDSRKQVYAWFKWNVDQSNFREKYITKVTLYFLARETYYTSAQAAVAHGDFSKYYTSSYTQIYTTPYLTSTATWYSVDITSYFLSWLKNPSSNLGIGFYIGSYKYSLYINQIYLLIDYVVPAINITSPSPYNFTITWDNIASSYTVYRNGQQIYSGSSTSCSDSVSANTQYTYTIVANDQPWASFSKTVTSAPVAPSSISVSTGGISWSNDTIKRGRGYVVLSWPAVAGATGYKVWVFDGYAYRAFDVGNATSWDSRVWKIWPDTNWLISQGNNTITTDVFNRVKGGEDLPDIPILLYQKTAGTTYDSDTKYYFRVSAYNSYGYESSQSSTVTDTLPNMTDAVAPTISSVILNDGIQKTGTTTI
ncbi:MAG: hypothetical protein ACPLSA_05555, partial [Caldanaerobacter sp.]